MPENSVRPYRVSHPGLVRDELRKLIIRAGKAGNRTKVLEAVKQIDDRLRIYPQFGEPLRDFPISKQTLWVMAIQQLCVQYVVDETNRMVFVVIPLKPMPFSGILGI